MRTQRLDRLRHRVRSGRRGVIRDVPDQRRSADRLRVLEALPAFGGIEDQLYVAVLDPVDDMRAALRDLVDAFDRYAVRFEVSGGAVGRDDAPAHAFHQPRGRDDNRLVAFLHRNEHRPFERQFDVGAQL